MRKYFVRCALALLLAATAPAFVQAQEANADTQRADQRDSDDRGEWGWLGLLGLAGLLGLRRREREDIRQGHAAAR
jgi:MYXO-CTERM domain-containing protein